MQSLKDHITLVIVTHNMQQASRVADYTAFMNMNPETRAGGLVEYGATQQRLNSPRDGEHGPTSRVNSADPACTREAGSRTCHSTPARDTPERRPAAGFKSDVRTAHR